MDVPNNSVNFEFDINLARNLRASSVMGGATGSRYTIKTGRYIAIDIDVADATDFEASNYGKMVTDIKILSTRAGYKSRK